MSQQINLHEAKSQLSRLVALAEAGEDIVIARANKPIVRLVPIAPMPVTRHLGEAQGLVRIAPDFETLPEDFMERFE